MTAVGGGSFMDHVFRERVSCIHDQHKALHTTIEVVNFNVETSKNGSVGLVLDRLIRWLKGRGISWR